jgi:glutamine synthetase type III
MELRDEAERRQAADTSMAVEIARLQEKVLSSEKQLTRIEQTLLDHAHNEEGMLRDITKALSEFKETIEEKINAAVNPVKDQVTKWQIVLGVFTFVGGGIMSLIYAFHDHIANLFK